VCPIRTFNEHKTLGELASVIGGTVHGDENTVVKGIGIPSESGKDILCVLWSREEVANLHEGALIAAPAEFFASGMLTGIEISDPRLAMAELLELVILRREYARGVHPLAAVSKTAQIAPSSFIGPFCVVDDNAVIAPGVVLEAGVYVGRNVRIGENSLMEPGVVLYNETQVGAGTVIHANAVIGIDGFGFIPSSGGAEPEKIPQAGRVVIGSNVEIGACSTVDRGTLGDTIIQDGVKTDNHVHVAHNVNVGKGCLLVAQTGLAGSSVLEDSVIMAARSGTADHVRIGKEARVAAMSGVLKNIPPRATVSGFPARDHRQDYRSLALVQRLPELFEKVRQIEKKLSESDKKGEE